MKPPRQEELQTILAQGRLDQTVGILRRLDADVAAGTFISLPFEQQQNLFMRLAVEFSARLVPVFPYYHSFVLLHTLSKDRMISIVGKVNPNRALGFSGRAAGRSLATNYGMRTSSPSTSNSAIRYSRSPGWVQ